jgi:hypothetical protein
LPRTLWLLRLALQVHHLLVERLVAVAVAVAGHLISELAAGALIAAIDKEFYGRT